MQFYEIRYKMCKIVFWVYEVYNFSETIYAELFKLKRNVLFDLCLAFMLAVRLSTINFLSEINSHQKNKLLSLHVLFFYLFKLLIFKRFRFLTRCCTKTNRSSCALRPDQEKPFCSNSPSSGCSWAEKMKKVRARTKLYTVGSHAFLHWKLLNN